MVGYFWGITFAFYTRADSRAALPCQPCFSPPPLIGSHPCQQPGSCPQEEKNRRIYISLTLPRLSDSSLLLAPAGPFKWTAFRVERGGGGGDAREGWSSAGMNGPGRNHSQSDWWPFDQHVTQGAGFEFQIPVHQMKTMSMFDRVSQPGLHPSFLHSTYYSSSCMRPTTAHYQMSDVYFNSINLVWTVKFEKNSCTCWLILYVIQRTEFSHKGGVSSSRRDSWLT